MVLLVVDTQKGIVDERLYADVYKRQESSAVIAKRTSATPKTDE